ncbi:TlpA family protein disulfide reductase [Actinomadura barringtoniae]|uniref:TlpA family protein disulfide reductase n=1 Tax=Actinomadura barringtoniae TaxID=1427535 RepID=UPI001FB7E968|nr:TlpA disulfide reductase family protein [Actinomadura barringtoniae]
MSPRVSPGKTGAIAVGAFVVAGLAAGCAGTSSAGGPAGSDNRFIAGDGNIQEVKAGERKAAPQAGGETLDGKQLKLSDLKGKVTIVNFWASWCAPCRGEAPSLEQVYTENKAKGVELVGVGFKDNKDGLRAFERKFKITYPSLFDDDGQITLAFRDVPPNAIPSTLILDRQGRVAARIVGSTTYSKLSPLVAKIAAEKA